jgi:serralysin
MCSLCSEFRASPDSCDYKGLETQISNLEEDAFSTTVSALSTQVYTYDQIAHQLTNVFWGGDQQRFDVEVGGTITYDISGLELPVLHLAEAAFDAWSAVTGLNFVNVGPASTGEFLTEGTTDAVASRSTHANMEVGDSFSGRLNGDTDWVAVELLAGQTYEISLLGDGTNRELEDPYMNLYNANGSLITSNDDIAFSSGIADSNVEYYAATDTTVYVGVGAYSGTTGGFGSGTGNYVVNVTEQANSFTSNADIFIDDEDSGGAYATSNGYGEITTSSEINITRGWADGSTELSSYTYLTFMHEIGHSLGLGHAGDYNAGGGGAISYDTHAEYLNDSWQATIMSYFDQGENTYIGGTAAIPVTLMPADIIAIRNLYGNDLTLNEGNTYYGANSNVDGYLGDVFGQFFDNDPLDSSIDGGDNISFTIVDGSGVDTVDFRYVNSAQTIRLGELEASDVGGLVGNMMIARGTIIENAIGGTGNDTIIGNDERNVLTGHRGADRLVGGGGLDVAGYYTATSAVVVDMQNGASSTGDARGDTYIEIEGIQGSRFGDTIRGDVNGNLLNGSGGNDTILGRGGNDIIVGGTGVDNLSGGDGNDVLNGGSGDDRIDGNAGNDRLVGVDGNDTLTDMLGRNSIIGGRGDDILQDGTGSSTLYSGSGDDRLTANGGNDLLIGGSGNDDLFGGGGRDRLAGDGGDDTIFGGGNTDIFIFRANDGNDTIGDFNVNEDRLFISAALMGGETDVSNLAQVTDSGVLLDFVGDNSVLLSGLTTLDGLDDTVLITI